MSKEKDSNPYIETVLKKIRNLKKKLQKIDKYEELNKEELNSDQIYLLEQKSFFRAVMKEMEDLTSFFLNLEIQDKDRLTTLEKQREEQVQELINEKVLQAQKIPKENLLKLLKLIGILQSRLEYAEFYTSPKEFKVLSCLLKDLVTEDKGHDLALGLINEDTTKYMGYSFLNLVQMINGLKVPNKANGSKMSFFVEDSLQPASSKSSSKNADHVETKGMNSSE